jgi:hypothetical protein
VPATDAEPLVQGGATLPLVWRSHYVVAVLDDVAGAVLARLQDKGFEVIVFGTTEAAWPDKLKQLAAALGRGA